MRRPRAGVVLTAPNTVLEADLWDAAGERMSFHASRVPDDAGHAPIDGVPAAVAAIRAVAPDLVLVGLSAEPFKRGADGHRRWKTELAVAAGCPVLTPADGIEAALRRAGARAVALLTPFADGANAPIEAYLGELGVTVTRSAGLGCTSTAAIAEVGRDVLAGAVRALDGPGVDAIVQVGTNLDFAAVAAAATADLGKPVLASNAELARTALASFEPVSPG